MIAYLDCSAGASGDMFLGALVDAGVSLRELEEGLKTIPVKGYRLEAKRVKRALVAATKVDVLRKSGVGSQESEARRWKDVQQIVTTSLLPVHIQQRGLRIFRSLFEAEGKVHGTSHRRTHLHELGAVDCIVDIFGTLIGLDLLGIEKVYGSAVNLGSGSVATEHGLLPVPAPATAELLKGIPVYSSGAPFELTTPTGAAILREIVDCFTAIPLMTVEKIGCGAGQRDVQAFPNVLRVLIGGEPSHRPAEHRPDVYVVETNIDDMNPQLYEYVMERLFGAGALDVYLTQVIMKKGRPGVLLTVLCTAETRVAVTEILFRETTTLGVRWHEASRTVLERELNKVETEFGTIRVKASRLGDGTIRYSPEYEDCKRIAQKHHLPLREVMALVSGRGRRKGR